jgi:hypothetical protein
MLAVTRGLRGRAHLLSQIARNRALTRLLGAYFANILTEYGVWIAVLVYAYERGGATLAGAVAIVQLVPAIFLSPVIVAHGSRFGVVRMLVVAYAGQATMLGCCAAAMLTHSPQALVYVSATVISVLLGVSRAMHSVMMPLVVRHPNELTAANVATSWTDGLGVVVGPAITGVLITIDGPGLACAALAAISVAMPLLASVRAIRTSSEADEQDGEAGGLADLVAAARVIASRPTTRALIAYPAGAAAIEGAIDLLVVILAVRILAIGPGAAGYLSAAFGLGGIIGAGVAVSLVGRRLAFPLAAAALLGSAALAGLALASTVPIAVALLMLVGVSRAVQSIAAQTLLQRSTPLDVIVCLFSLVESMRDIGLTFGSLVVPLFIALGGPDAAFVGMAAFAPLIVVFTAGRLRRADDSASVPVVEMGVLRNLEMFAALPQAPLETLAREANYSAVPTGAEIVHEGEPGDEYFAIVDGAVTVTCNGSEVNRLAEGDGFGEIALLHDVPRTATVTATAATSLLGIGREAFLTAMHASPLVHARARQIAGDRRAGPGPLPS